MLHVMPGKARTQDSTITGLYWAVVILWTIILIFFVSAVVYPDSISDVSEVDFQSRQSC